MNLKTFRLLKKQNIRGYAARDVFAFSVASKQVSKEAPVTHLNKKGCNPHGLQPLKSLIYNSFLSQFVDVVCQT